MEVILKEDVNKLGHRGDVVKGRRRLRAQLSAAGQARHRGECGEQGSHRTDEGLGRSQVGEGEGRRPRICRRSSMRLSLVFERKVGENEHLFGSVTSGDIAHQLEAKGFTVDRRKISLEEPLKTIGEYHVPVKLHREVTSHMKVTVKGDQPEAEVAAAATEYRLTH